MAIDPRKLEQYADQEWIATKAIGQRDPGATSLKNTRDVFRLRNTGKRCEKYNEEIKKVTLLEPHAGPENLIGSAEQAGRVPRGVPAVQHHELLDGALAGQWAPLKFKHEFFSVNHVRGVSLESLDVDPGPMYAISHSRAKPSWEQGEQLSAPTLMNVTRAVNASFPAGQEGGDGFERQAAEHSSMSTHAGIPAAGGGVSHTLQLNMTRGRQGVTSKVDQRFHLGESAGAQFHGIVGAAGSGASAVDVSAVGSQVAIVTARDARLTRGTLLGEAKPGDGRNATYADHGLSGGVVAEEGAGAPGGPQPVIHTVLHPLDAFPGTKRLVAEEKVGHIDAEKFRKGIASQAVRRQFVSQAVHPHGVLGVESMDNENSALYGELASTRRAAREAAAVHAAHREAHIQRMTRSDARRGYDILKSDESAALTSTRVIDATLARDPVAAARDGVKMMDSKRRIAASTDELVRSLGGTSRVLRSEPVSPPKPSAAIRAAARANVRVERETGGRTWNLITGALNPGFPVLS